MKGRLSRAATLAVRQLRVNRADRASMKGAHTGGGDVSMQGQDPVITLEPR